MICWFCKAKFSRFSNHENSNIFFNCLKCKIKIVIYKLTDSSIRIEFDNCYLYSAVLYNYEDEPNYSIIGTRTDTKFIDRDLIDLTQFASLEELQIKLLGYLAML